VGGDKGYDTRGFVADVRAAGFTPHVAQHTTNRRSAIDGRTTRHGGYGVSQRKRKRVEEPFGWLKTVGEGRKLRFIGQDRNRAWFKTGHRRLQPGPDREPRHHDDLTPGR